MNCNYQFELEGTMFGETYHIGALMALSETKVFQNPKQIYENRNDEYKKLTEAQQFFLDSITAFRRDKAPYKVSELTISATRNEVTYIVAERMDALGKGIWLMRILEAFLNGGFHDKVDYDEYKNKMKTDWLDKTYKLMNDKPKAAIWIRNKKGDKRNITDSLIKQIIEVLKTNKIAHVVFVGDNPESPIFYDDNATNLINFYKEVNFKKEFCLFNDNANTQRDRSYCAQLQFYRLLYRVCNLKMIIGMKSGALDGPTLIGVPTIFFDDQKTTNPPGRMQKFADTIPWARRIDFEPALYNSQSKEASKLKMPENSMKSLNIYVQELMEYVPPK